MPVPGVVQVVIVHFLPPVWSHEADLAVVQIEEMFDELVFGFNPQLGIETMPARRRQGPSLPAAVKAVRRRAPGLLAIGETLSWRAEEKLRQAHLQKCKRIHQGAFQLLLISRNSPPRKLGVRRRLKQNGQHWAAQSPKVKINRSGVGMWKVTMTQMKTTSSPI